jgi:hypothetical protein
MDKKYYYYNLKTQFESRSQGLDHELRWSIRVYQKKYKKGIKAILFPPKKDSNKNQRGFGSCFILD